MSASREKKRRARLNADYKWELCLWYRSEPPKLMFISHWRWKREKPVIDLKADK